MEKRHRDFLMSLGAGTTPHSGRVLFEHLKGVHDLLRDWDNVDDVCIAGLYHSIYGTNTFKHVSFDSRDRLREVIGERAELLVHYFSTKDRPLFETVDDEPTRLQLMEIEAANLLEQGSTGRWLRKLPRNKLSNGARAAINGGAI